MAGSGGGQATTRKVRRAVRARTQDVKARFGVAGGGWAAAEHIHFHPRVRQFVAMVSILPAGRVLDLGSGHGVFAQICSAMGWEVTAQDVRATRFPQQARGIRWEVGDVLDLQVDRGEYDLVLCLGLLYHLDLDGQLALLRTIGHTPLLLDTHVSTPEDLERSPHKNQLSDVVTVQGYTGRYYTEVPGKTLAERRDVSTASWGNDRSFWADQESMTRMLKDCGYGDVLAHEKPHVYGRTFQLCIPKRSVKAMIAAGSPPRGPARQVSTVVRTAARGRSADRPGG